MGNHNIRTRWAVLGGLLALLVGGALGATTAGMTGLSGLEITPNSWQTNSLRVNNSSGTAQVTATTAGALTLGSGSTTVAVNSSVWGVSTAGAVTGLGDVTFATGLTGGADITCASAAADTAGQTIDVLGQAGGTAGTNQVGKNGGAVTITAGAGSAKNGTGANDGDGGGIPRPEPTPHARLRAEPRAALPDSTPARPPSLPAPAPWQTPASASARDGRLTPTYLRESHGRPNRAGGLRWAEATRPPTAGREQGSGSSLPLLRSRLALGEVTL